IRVLTDAVTGIKGQAPAMPSRRRSLSVLYLQLGQLYREVQNYQAAIYTFEELGHLGDEEDRRARMMIMDTYRAAKDLPRALQTGCPASHATMKWCGSSSAPSMSGRSSMTRPRKSSRRCWP